MRRSTLTRPTHVNIYPFGGLGEIGMNMLALEVESDVVVFDCGFMFQDLGGWGLDYCLPNFTKLFELKSKLKGLVLTHGHEDHIGAVGHFCGLFPDVPVYASPLTRDLVLAKQDDFPVLREKKIRTFHEHTPFKVGGFEISPVGVSHSIPDSHGFVIDCTAGRLIHSGDVRYEYEHLRKFEKWFHKNHYFHRYTDRPILCYLGDSTNVESSHPSLTEDTIGKNIARHVKDQKSGLMVITLFASNMERLARIFDVVSRADKKVVLCGRSMKTYVEIGQVHGVIPKFRGLIIDEVELEHLPRNKVVVVSTGSQAEPRSALMRIAHGMHRHISLELGDRVLMSSRFIPGNERNISRMINAMMIQGAEVTTASDDDLHVSGHAYAEESLMTLKALRPQYFIPVHGEYHHMVRHAKLARSLGSHGPQHVLVVRNGKPVSLSEEGYSELTEFDVSRWTYDYGSLTPLICPSISQRKRMGKYGLVVCSMKPKLQLFSMGLPIDDACLQMAEAHREGLMRAKRLSVDERLKQMKSFLLGYFRRKYDRKPYVIITAEEFQPYETPS